MPNTKSGKKRLRQDGPKRILNSGKKSRIRSTKNILLSAISAGDAEVAKKAYAGYCSALDKAVKTNVIAKNNAIRSKRRAAALLSA